MRFTAGVRHCLLQAGRRAAESLSGIEQWPGIGPLQLYLLHATMSVAEFIVYLICIVRGDIATGQGARMLTAASCQLPAAATRQTFLLMFVVVGLSSY